MLGAVAAIMDDDNEFRETNKDTVSPLNNQPKTIIPSDSCYVR